MCLRVPAPNYKKRELGTDEMANSSSQVLTSNLQQRQSWP